MNRGANPESCAVTSGAEVYDSSNEDHERGLAAGQSTLTRLEWKQVARQRQLFEERPLTSGPFFTFGAICRTANARPGHFDLCPKRIHNER